VGPGVRTQQAEPTRKPALHLGLQAMVARVVGHKVCAVGPDVPVGTGVVHAAQTRIGRQKTENIRTAYCPGTWPRIVVTDETGKFGPVGTDVTDLEEEVFGQLTLDVQVPLLDVRPPVVPVSAVRGRRRDTREVNARKHVSEPAHGEVSVKPVKCLCDCVRPVAPELAPFPGHQSRVEHAIATSDGGAIIEAVGESKTGGEVVPVGGGNFPSGIGRQAENIGLAGPDESEVSVRSLAVVKTEIVPGGGV